MLSYLVRTKLMVNYIKREILVLTGIPFQSFFNQHAPEIHSIISCSKCLYPFPGLDHSSVVLISKIKYV